MENSKTIIINEEEINVLQYLSFEDKSEIVQLACQEATEPNGMIDFKKGSVLIEVYSILYYTDIKVTDEEKAEPFKLYDRFMLDGIIEQVEKAIPYEERRFIKEYYENYYCDLKEYNQSFIGFVNKIAAGLPDIVKALEDELIPALQKQVDGLKQN